MNTKQPYINFTSEFEKKDSFSLLDIKITRSNNQLHQLFVKQHLTVFLPTLKVYACRIQVWLSLHFTSLFFFHVLKITFFNAH